MEDEILTPQMVAAILGVKVTTLWTWRYKGQGPEGFKLGSSKSAPIRYQRSDVQAWINERKGAGAS